jgi:hypothetical protein
MDRKHVKVVREVAANLWEAERTADLAIASSARLLASMVDARLEVEWAASMGHELVTEIVSSLNNYVTNRGILLETHDRLNAFKASLGFGEFAFGGGGDKEVPLPPSGVVSFTQQRAA